MKRVSWDEIEVGQHYWFVPSDDSETSEILRCATNPTAFFTADKVLMDFSMCIWTSENVEVGVLYHVPMPETWQ